MRLHLQLSQNNKTIPFNYQHLLTGCIHKWLGKENKEHDNVSLYSFSWIQGVRTNKAGIDLSCDANFFISFYDVGLAKKTIKGIMESPEMFYGVRVLNISLQNTPQFSNNERFLVASPILIKRKLDDGSLKHFTYNDEASSLFLTETLQTKAKEAGVAAVKLNIYFDKDYINPRTKIISYKNIHNRVNVCPVIIEGTPEVISFAWDVGLGNSTGIGFGAIK